MGSRFSQPAPTVCPRYTILPPRFRATLMSARHVIHTGVYDPMNGGSGDLSLNFTLLPEQLKAIGYQASLSVSFSVCRAMKATGKCDRILPVSPTALSNAALLESVGVNQNDVIDPDSTNAVRKIQATIPRSIRMLSWTDGCCVLTQTQTLT